MDFAMAGVDHQPFVIRLADQDFQPLFPNPGIPPPDKTVVRVAPPAQIGRQIAPRHTRSQNPENSIDKQMVVFCNAAPCALTTGKMWLQ